MAYDFVKESDQGAGIDGGDLFEVFPDGLCFKGAVGGVFREPALEVALKVIGAKKDRKRGGLH